jgi:hypothetical protein
VLEFLEKYGLQIAYTAALFVGIFATVGEALRKIPPPPWRVVIGMVFTSIAASVAVTTLALFAMPADTPIDKKVFGAAVSGMFSGALSLTVFAIAERVMNAWANNKIKITFEGPPKGGDPS